MAGHVCRGGPELFVDAPKSTRVVGVNTSRCHATRAKRLNVRMEALVSDWTISKRAQMALSAPFSKIPYLTCTAAQIAISLVILDVTVQIRSLVIFARLRLVIFFARYAKEF